MAQRHPGSSQVHRTASTDDEDLFVAKTLEFSGWARKNSQALILLSAALAAVVVLVVYYSGRTSERRLAAASELEIVSQTIGTGQLDTEAGKAELARFIDRFDGTPNADEARLFLAQLHLNDGEGAQAVAVLEGSSLSLREGLGTQIAVLRARALEASGQLDAAEALYVRLANDAPMQFQEVDALEDAARLRVAKGDFAGAAELYERLLDLAPEGSQPAAIYEMRLAEVRAAQR